MSISRSKTTLAVLSLLVLASCYGGRYRGDVDETSTESEAVADTESDDRPDAASVVDTGASDTEAPVADVTLLATKAVGPEGGLLVADGLALAIPAGALSATTEVSVHLSKTKPESIALGSPVFRFEPEGLAFDAPVEVALTVELPEGAEANLYWSLPGGEGWQVIGSPQVVGPSGKAELRGFTRHFSEAYGGVSCAPTALPGNCDCISDDAKDGGRLCTTNPGLPTEPCPPGGQIFRGVEGDSCAGTGLVPVFLTTCFCSGDTTGKQLCPVPPDPPYSDPCQVPGGMRSHNGPAGSFCYGYYIAQDGNGADYPQGESGIQGNCASTRNGSEWRPLQGTLAECYGDDPEIPSPPPLPTGCEGFDFGTEP